MAVYKDNATGTWRVIYRFTNWKGERKQTQKRGFATKREALAWEHEVKRTDNLAVLDVVGRDQPDQELTIEFDREHCVWKFKKAETELWKQPPNPLLEAINNFLTEDKPEWEGTATELAGQLTDIQIQANVLSRKLNVANSQLLNDYGIFYNNKRGHERKIILKRLEPKE